MFLPFDGEKYELGISVLFRDLVVMICVHNRLDFEDGYHYRLKTTFNLDKEIAK